MKRIRPSHRDTKDPYDSLGYWCNQNIPQFNKNFVRTMKTWLREYDFEPKSAVFDLEGESPFNVVTLTINLVENESWYITIDYYENYGGKYGEYVLHFIERSQYGEKLIHKDKVDGTDPCNAKFYIDANKEVQKLIVNKFRNVNVGGILR